MGKYEKLLVKILRGNTDKNIDFEELINLMERLGFSFRITGSHNIFYRDSVEEIINLQPKGKSAKAYQVKQVREIIQTYQLDIQDNES